MRPLQHARPPSGKLTTPLERHRGLDRRDCGVAATGQRRHDPHIADPRARWRSDTRGRRRAGDPADDGPTFVFAAGERVPGLRPHDQCVFPGAGQQDPGLPTRADVNGPGESKLANIGISLPGTGEVSVAPVR
jgi:hypothetical protein